MARSTTPPPGCSALPGWPPREREQRAADRGSGLRTGRRPVGDRAVADPLGTLPGPGSGEDPRGRARCPDRDAVARGPDRRAGRGRRGPPAGLAVVGGVRPAPHPRPAPQLRPLGLGRGGAGADAGGARSRDRDHECARGLLAADRRVRPDDDPGGQPPAAGAPRTPARADVAAARGRRTPRRHGRDRGPWLDRTGGRCARDGLRLPSRRGPASLRRRAGEPGRRRDTLLRRGDARPGRRAGEHGGAAGRVRLRRACGAAHARDRGHDRWPGAGGDEALSLADQHRPRAARRRAGPARSPPRGPDRSLGRGPDRADDRRPAGLHAVGLHRRPGGQGGHARRGRLLRRAGSVFRRSPRRAATAASRTGQDRMCPPPRRARA